MLKSGIVKPEDADKIVDYIDITLPGAIDKARIVMLDILANNDWKRPIYFTGGSMDSAEYLWMKDYLQLDGLVYKLVPIKTPIDKNNPYDMGRIDSELMYNIVKRWTWGNMGKEGIYLDPETRKNSIIFRGNLARLTEQLMAEGKTAKASEIIDIAMKNMPIDAYGYYFTLDPFIEGSYKVGKKEQARAIALQVIKKYQEELNYYTHLPARELNSNAKRIQYCIDRYGEVVMLSETLDKEFYTAQWAIFKDKAGLFMGEKELEEYFKGAASQAALDSLRNTLIDTTATSDSTEE